MTKGKESLRRELARDHGHARSTTPRLTEADAAFVLPADVARLLGAVVVYGVEHSAR